MEFLCSPPNAGAKITVTPKIDAQGAVTFDIYPEPKTDIKPTPRIDATYFIETKELKIYEVVRGPDIAPRQRFLQHMLKHLINTQGLDIACVNYASITNEHVVDLLLPLYKRAPENLELIEHHVNPDALRSIPMVSALIELGFQELHIVPLSQPGGGIFGLEGVRSGDLSLRKIPIKSQPSWNSGALRPVNFTFSKNDSQ